MAINSNQLHVAKIYPGNYTNVARREDRPV